MSLSVAMVSTFGPNVRGVSPYADPLSSAIEKIDSITLTKIDYANPFPQFILPKGTSYTPNNDYASLNYRSPSSWDIHNTSDFDVVHFQYWSPAFLPIILAVIWRMKKYRKKIVVTWHNPSPHESFPLLNYWERKLADAADLIICHSKSAIVLMHEAGISTDIRICHHGCVVSPQSAATHQDYAQCGLDQTLRYLLFFGNIRPYKGVDVLLDAWRDMGAQFPDLRLIIAGRLWGQNQSAAAKLIHTVAGTSSYAKIIKEKLHGSANVIEDLNFISEDKLNSYLRIAKFGVFPYSSFESQSGAASLAAGLGLPIISTDVGGLSQLAINDTFVCRSNSAVALRECLEVLLRRDDPSLKEKQLEKASHYSWEASAALHASCYEQLV